MSLQIPYITAAPKSKNNKLFHHATEKSYNHQNTSDPTLFVTIFHIFSIYVIEENVEVTEEETDYVETSPAAISPQVTATDEVHSFSSFDLCQESPYV